MPHYVVSSTPKSPTNRKFGWFFVAILVTVASYSYSKGWNIIFLVFLILAALFSIVTIVFPHWLSPLNRLWYKFGLFLGRVVSPVVLGIIFFLLITPVSLVTRLFGRDELLIRRRSVQSYWVDRTPSGPPSRSFRNQF